MQSETIFYKRSRFITHLPAGYLYSPSHYWIAPMPADSVGRVTPCAPPVTSSNPGAHGVTRPTTTHENIWRVGLTKFATRMLGEMVDHGLDVEPCAAVSPGQVIGWVEGFKALSDVYCIAEGQFVDSNPVLKEKVILLGSDCYRSGWLYSVRGKPDEKCMDVRAYCAILDQTIDKILEKEKADESKS